MSLKIIPERSKFYEWVSNIESLFGRVHVTEDGQGVSVVDPLQLVVVDESQIAVKTILLQMKQVMLGVVHKWRHAHSGVKDFAMTDLSTKKMTMVEGVKIYPQLREVINGRLLIT